MNINFIKTKLQKKQKLAQVGDFYQLEIIGMDSWFGENQLLI